MRKKELRKNYLAKQKSLTKSELREKSLHINGLFFDMFNLDNIRYLHLFLSIREKSEIDTSCIINDLWGDWVNIKTVVPRVDFEKDILEHLEFNSGSTLKVSHWGIPEPIGDEFIDVKKLDIVLVPMLCFDKKGYRVGYGKGFYDKFLRLCREDCLKIGLSLFSPIQKIENVRDYDVKLDYCITPNKIYNFTDL